MSGPVLIEESVTSKQKTDEKENFVKNHDTDVEKVLFVTIPPTLADEIQKDTLTLADEIQKDTLNSQNFEKMLVNGLPECDKLVPSRDKLTSVNDKEAFPISLRHKRPVKHTETANNEREDKATDALSKDIKTEGGSIDVNGELMLGEEIDLGEENEATAFDVKPYRCHICGKLFSRNSSLKCHVRLHIEGPENLLRSGNAPSAANQSSDAAADTKAEKAEDASNSAAEQNHRCIFCEKGFNQKSGLKCHMQLHIKSFQSENGEDQERASERDDEATADAITCPSGDEYSCVLCDQTFSTKSRLIVHYKLHPPSAVEKEVDDATDEPVVENHSKGGSREIRNGISDGATTTTDEGTENDEGKQYKCYICDKQFARNSSLMWHIQFHETYSYSKLKKASDSQCAEIGVKQHTWNDSIVDSDRTCSICGKAFETIGGFKRHMAFHGAPDTADDANGSSVSEHRCDLCDKRFATISGLKRHVSVVHRMLPEDSSLMESVDETLDGCGEFKCELCDRSFSQVGSLRKHMWVHDTAAGDRKTRSCTCERCGRTFTTPSNMTKHATFHCKGFRDPEQATEESAPPDTEDGEYQCDHCNRSFCSIRAMRIHSSSQHKLFIDVGTIANDGDLVDEDSGGSNAGKSGEFNCDECGKTFGSVRNMKIHYAHAHHSKWDDNYFDDVIVDEIGTNRGGVECPVCQKVFESLRGMKIHASSHKPDGASLEEKRASVEPEGEGSFECEICGVHFSQFRSFRVHVGWHSRHNNNDDSTTAHAAVDDEIKCEHCDRTFANTQAKAGHMKVHTRPSGENEKVVAEKKEEIVTKNLDSGEKTHACSKCGKMYSRMGLVGHMRFHKTRPSIGTVIKARSLPQKPDPISIVPEKLDPPLTTFQQVGTIDELLYCNVCDMTFIRKQDLAKHVRMHLCGMTKDEVDLEVHRCKLCQRSFAGRKSLNTHVAYHHTMDRECSPDVGVKRASTNARSPTQKRFCSVSLAGRSQALETDTVDGKRRKRSTFDNSFYEYESSSAYKCDECGKTFPTKLGLQRHGAFHKQTTAARTETTKMESEMPFECVYCEMCFTEKEALLDHVRLHEEGVLLDNELGASKSEPMCDIDLGVGEHFVILDPEGKEEYFIFEQHEESEGYQCNECDESYLDKLQMIIHMSYHMGKRRPNGHAKPVIIKADSTILAPYKCNFCEERFINKSFLCRHELKRHGSSVFKSESGERPGEPPSDLKLPNGELDAETKNRCDYCSKYFTSKWFLKRHMRKQCTKKSKIEVSNAATASPPIFSYQCEFCDFEFSEKAKLTEHMQAHVLTYNCDNCDFECENVTELYTHACSILTTEV